MNRDVKAMIAACACVFISTGAIAQPIEAFARLPEIRDIQMSPNGDSVAMVGNNADGYPYLMIHTPGRESEGFLLEEHYKVYSVRWIGENYLALIVSYNETFEYTPTGTLFSEEFKYQVSRTLIVDRDDLSATDAFDRLQGQLGVNFGLANIVAIDHDAERIYIPALVRTGDYDLFEIDAANLRGRSVARGDDDTRSWVIGPDFEPAARLDYDDGPDIEEIYSFSDGDARSISRISTPIRNRNLLGVDDTGQSLIVGDVAGSVGLYTINRESGETSVLYERSDYDAYSIMKDPYSQQVVGVRYSDDRMRSYWFDDGLGSMESALAGAFPDRHVMLESWDRNRRNFIVSVEGVDSGAEYYHFNRDTGQARPLGLAYPELGSFGLLARREAITYTARDGVEIPAYLTTPRGAVGATPLVVLPHGGPEARDFGGFDWIAHLFASRGYRVLQPNFRGSTGYGTAFRNAGRGEWGGLMQDDVTDGVQHLIDNELVDPDRICIVGASYGGYSALAGAVKTPDLYACVAAIAPVTDLPDQIFYAKDRYGVRNWVVAYWTEVIG
ncbi:MAG: prolyl oligopeptidase family serine peptidase, partial [Maricaulaceae bacterium]